MFCTFTSALPAVCVQCTIWLVLQSLNFTLSRYVAQVLSEQFWNCSSGPYYYRYHFGFHIPHALNLYCEVLLFKSLLRFIIIIIISNIRRYATYLPVRTGTYYYYYYYYSPLCSTTSGTYRYFLLLLLLLVVVLVVVVVVVVRIAVVPVHNLYCPEWSHVLPTRHSGTVRRQVTALGITAVRGLGSATVVVLGTSKNCGM